MATSDIVYFQKAATSYSSFTFVSSFGGFLRLFCAAGI